MANTKVTKAVLANDAVGLDQLEISNDPSNGQALTYVASSNDLQWATISGGASDINGLSDAKTFGTSSIMIGDTTTGTIDAADNNTGLGIDIFAALTSGDRNTTVGGRGLTALTTGSNNTAIGYNAGQGTTTGSKNTFIGDSAGNENTTASFNTAVGYTALLLNTTGTQNNAFGAASLDACTTGSYNCGFGQATLSSTTTASQNVAMGDNAMQFNTTGGNNVGIGQDALRYCATGVSNTAVGHQALDACTGNNNTAFGKDALGSLTTGGHNVACGLNALVAQTTPNNNTAMGSGAGIVCTTGDKNTFIGRESGVAVTTGSNSVYVGGSAGYDVTVGGQNVIVGVNNQGGGTGSSYRTILGYGLAGHTNDATLLGRGSNDSQLTHGSTSWSAPSDVRLKEEIEDEQIGLDFINELRPVTFRWKKAEDVPQEMKAHEDSEERVMNGKYNHGFIAQEVKKVINKYDFKDGFDLWSEDETDGRQRVGEASLIPMLVKAIQELSQEVKQLKGE